MNHPTGVFGNASIVHTDVNFEKVIPSAGTNAENTENVNNWAAAD